MPLLSRTKPPRKKFVDPGLNDPNAPFTPAFQSIPGRSPAIRSQERTGETAPDQPVINRNSKGDITSVQTPDGRTFVGLSQKDFKQVAAGTQGPKLIEGTIEGSVLKRQREAQGLLQGLQTGFGEPEITDPNRGLLNAPGTNVGQAIGVGFGAAVPAAGAGGLVGGPPGAIAGGILAFVGAAYANLRSQQSGEISARAVNLAGAKTQFANIISAVNQGADPAEAVATWNGVISDTYAAWGDLKQQTSGDAAAFGDGTKQLEQFEIFFRPGGTLETYNLKFSQALVNPNPNKIEAGTIEDFSSGEE